MGLICGSSIHNLVNILVVIIVLMGQTNWAEGQAATESESETDYLISPSNVVNNEVFHIVVIGDSIAWGAGLNRDDKYSHLVAKWLAEKLGRPVNVEVLAHTGATLNKETLDPICPPDLSSGNPTAFQQSDMISSPNDVELILVSAGINDVGVGDIIKLDHVEGPFDNLKNRKVNYDATCSIDDIRDRSASIKEPMRALLNKLLKSCPNAKIVVTSYYPIISDESRGLTETIKALSPDSQNIGDYQNLDDPDRRNQLRDKSNAFYEESTRSIIWAINNANSDSEANRVACARINFLPNNCYGSSQSLLWKIGNFYGQVETDDDKFDRRMSLLLDLGWGCICGELCISPAGDEDSPVVEVDSRDLNHPGLDNCDVYRGNKFVAVGHPNKDGALKYKDAILETAGEKWPEWLQPTVQAFDVTPISLTLGESFTIDYTVSDNDGSGLKQVELWRKNEQSDWQKIETYSIDAGGDDPLASSFTHSPQFPGKYWYGIHVVDNANNWNDQWNSNTNGKPLPFEPVEVDVIGTQEINPSISADETSPWIESFYVEPLSMTSGASIAIHYRVSDNDGSGLKQVELWRKDEQSDWQEVQRNALNGETGPVSDSFTDSPTDPGNYWYGLHVVDNANNWNDQWNSNTDGKPLPFEPAEVQVMSAHDVTLTLYIHEGTEDGPVLAGAEVTGQDGSGISFEQTTDINGYVTITGAPGTWSFSVSAEGYETNNWDQEITETDTKHSFLKSIPQVTELDGIYRCESCWEYLRFYSDGTVIGASAIEMGFNPVESWLNKENPSVSVGHYTIRGSTISFSFSTSSKKRVIDFNGEISDDTLTLHDVQVDKHDGYHPVVRDYKKMFLGKKL